MKTTTFFSALLLTLMILPSGCKKYDEGFGGNASLSGKVVHHSRAIPNAVVLIKFDAKEAPGADTTAYDASTVADSAGNYSFTGLRAGNYFLYGTGFDASISMAVFGGTPVKLKSDDESKTIDVPVTEE